MFAVSVPGQGIVWDTDEPGLGGPRLGALCQDRRSQAKLERGVRDQAGGRTLGSGGGVERGRLASAG